MTPHVTAPDIHLTTTGEVVATVDERFVSYNIEMVEVTGGEFWKPYDAGPGKVYRPPIDLRSERLRNLAKALGPSYIRVSGTWANFTYFDADGTSGGTSPRGFNGVLSGEQWRGVGEFAREVDGEVVTSFAASRGTRDTDGAWLDDQARALLDAARSDGVPVVGAEFFNEPSLPIGVPKGYDAAGFRRDFATFLRLMRDVAPHVRIVGPGSTGAAVEAVVASSITPEDLLAASASALDVVSYHSYPKLSERCGSAEGPEVALDPAFLARVEGDHATYRALRDRHVPGAPMWVTEIAQAGCGGDRWASRFRDVFRFVDSLGRLAHGNGNAVFHNTLAASDYGLLDEIDFVPRPNYWAAVLWKQLMGTEVLALPVGDPTAGLTVYAHRTANRDGTTFAVVNASQQASVTLATESGKAEVYLLSADNLDSASALLNGRPLAAASDGTVGRLAGAPVEGRFVLPPTTVTFVVDPLR